MISRKPNSRASNDKAPGPIITIDTASAAANAVDELEKNSLPIEGLTNEWAMI